MAKVKACNLFDLVRRIGRIKNLTPLEEREIAESAMKWVGDNCCPIEVFGLETIKDAIEEAPTKEIEDEVDLNSTEE